MPVGDQVIRKREPRNRYEETPLRGEIVAIYGEKARVRWTEAVRYAGRDRGDNHSVTSLSNLLPATPENIRRAESKLKGRMAQAWIDRARFYEQMAEVREGQHLPSEAEWMRAEATEARRHAQEVA